MIKNLRIIPKIDVKNFNLVKGIHLEGLRVLGDPKVFIKYYYDSGADEIMDYLEMSKDEFYKLCDDFRSPHLWVNTNKEGFKLRHTINEDGEND